MTRETPRSVGYRLPAEWEPHECTWLAWPRNRETWPDKFEPIPGVFANLARTLAAFEPVHICAGSEEVMAEARRFVGDVPNVFLHDIPTNDAWCRDHGPMFLAARADLPPALVDWQYNAWGGKYPPFDLDNQVPKRVAQLTGRRRYDPGIVLEGGAIDTDGAGTLLTTESCLLNPNRNPGLGREQIEQYLRDYACVDKVLWLAGGMAGDDTDGHVDQLARFVAPATVVIAIENDSHDENYAYLQADYRRLQAMTDAGGRSLTVVPIEMPRPKYFNSQRLPASYLNFYIANGVVIVPQFGDPADQSALTTLARFYPNRQVLGLDALDLVWGLGAFHCCTHEQPA